MPSWAGGGPIRLPPFVCSPSSSAKALLGCAARPVRALIFKRESGCSAPIPGQFKNFMPDRFFTDTIDAELAPGARNAIRVCLQLKPDERITIITDEATREIAAALQAEVEEIDSEHAVFVLENYDSRPLSAMPRIILDDLARSQVSIFAAQSQPGELGSRMQMSDVVNKQHIRHGHMVNISRQIMLEGMRADFRMIDRLSQRLVERAR